MRFSGARRLRRDHESSMGERPIGRATELATNALREACQVTGSDLAGMGRPVRRGRLDRRPRPDNHWLCVAPDPDQRVANGRTLTGAEPGPAIP